ncbi:MAG: hypothetical protein DWP97_07875 [Calditrichaeota bacterium]|nr:MAG: hypothetical protein DWP97_07875 [Calditrichota bacterium]
MFVFIVFSLTLYLSQLIPYMHIHHSHEGDSSRIQFSYHIENTDFTNNKSSDHDHDHHHHDDEQQSTNDHQHSFDDFISWHVIRAQNIQNVSTVSNSALKTKSLNRYMLTFSDFLISESDVFISVSVPTPSIIRGPPSIFC